MIMMSDVVLMSISALYFNIITSGFMIQQTLTYVCHRTNNYCVTLFIKKHVVFLATGNRIRNILLLHRGIFDVCRKATVPSNYVLWHNESVRWFPLGRSFLKCEPDRFLRCLHSDAVPLQFLSLPFLCRS